MRDFPARAADSPPLGTPSASSFSIAFCIVGQLARFEWASKSARIFKPSLAAGHELGVFAVLSRGGANYVNRGGGRGGNEVLSDGRFTHFDESRLRRVISSTLPSTSGVDVQLLNESSTGFLHDPTWAKAMDKGHLGPASMHRRQRLHLLQWSHLRNCMFMIDRHEVAAGRLYGAVAKLRDDSFALAPFVVPPAWARVGITTISCLAWWGLMDAVFVVGRRWAWHIMEGMSADWYLSHGHFGANPKTIPKNPESWLALLAAYRGVPSMKVSVCDIPLISMRFLRRRQNASIAVAAAPAAAVPLPPPPLRIVIKRLHYYFFLNEGSCNANATARCQGPQHKSRWRTKLRSLGACPANICSS